MLRKTVIVSTSSNRHAEGPLLVSCPRLLIQYIRSYLPSLKVVPPFATSGCAMLWLHGQTYGGSSTTKSLNVHLRV
jgi:hypothetical protein